MSGSLTERLREALGEHALILEVDSYGHEGCYCAWRRDGWDAPAHEVHLADVAASVVEAWLGEQREAVARSIADAFGGTHDPDNDGDDWRIEGDAALATLRAGIGVGDDECQCGHDHGVSETTCVRCHWCATSPGSP